MPRPEKVRLGELLIAQGYLTEPQLTEALAAQKASGRKLGRVLVETGLVSEAQIATALARQFGIPFVDLAQASPKPELIKLLPETQARRFRALVIGEEGGALQVGMADPTDLFAYDEIHRLVRRDITLAAVTESSLLAAIDRLYRRTDEISGLARELQQELSDEPLDFGIPSAGAEDAPVVKLIQSMFEDAVAVRASDIHIEPQEKNLQLRFRIDGVLHPQTEADLRIAGALAIKLKLMAGLDISEKRLPQDGRFAMTVRGNPVDVRFSTLPTQYGESVVMRLLNQSAGILSLDRVGMPAAMLERFRAIIHHPSGLVLVTGPTGSGKTTTLYGALSELNTPDRKIITVEDPVEYRLPGINQVQANDKIEFSFARALRSMLRQDPDVILVGEMRDSETAHIGLRAALTGHMVFSTLHTNDAASTPVRLLDMGVPRFMVANALAAVLAQRLVRKVCAICAAPYTPDAREASWLRDAGNPRGEWMKGAGCGQCSHTGYSGRMAVYEMLEFTPELADAAGHSDPAHFIRAAQEAMRGAMLKDQALAHAARGRTSLAEAMRIAVDT
jgi:MSHA biogenesis protein MshE